MASSRATTTTTIHAGIQPKATNAHKHDEDVALHQTGINVTDERTAIGTALGKKLRRLIGLFEIPVPWMIRDETGVVPGEVIHRPIRRDDVRIIVSAINSLGVALAPARPTAIANVRIVIIRKRICIVVKQTF